MVDAPGASPARLIAIRLAPPERTCLSRVPPAGGLENAVSVPRLTHVRLGTKRAAPPTERIIATVSHVMVPRPRLVGATETFGARGI